MLKITILCLALFPSACASSFAVPDAGLEKTKGEYTHIYIAALDLNIWSSEKVVSIDELRLDSPLFLKARAEGWFMLRFEKGYSIKIEGSKLFYGDSVVSLGSGEHNIYVTPKDYQLGVFIRLFDK